MSFPIVVADQFANMVHLAMHQRSDAELGEPILLLRDALRAPPTQTQVGLSFCRVWLTPMRMPMPSRITHPIVM